MEALNVDEVVGQLLASEGFTSVEELALVDVKELAGIEGFRRRDRHRIAEPRLRNISISSRPNSRPSARNLVSRTP